MLCLLELQLLPCSTLPPDHPNLELGAIFLGCVPRHGGEGEDIVEGEEGEAVDGGGVEAVSGYIMLILVPEVCNPLSSSFQLTLFEPKWVSDVDAILFATYRDQQHLILFLMGLSDVYEPVRASFLHRIPLLTLDQAISEFLSEETCLGLILTSYVDTTLATPGSKGRGPSSGSRDTRPQSTTVNVGVSSITSASDTLIDVSDLPAFVQRIMSSFGNPFIALSASLGISPWYFDSGYSNHMTFDLSIFSSKSSESSFPVIYTTNGSSMTVDHVGHVSTSALSLPHTYYVRRDGNLTRRTRYPSGPAPFRAEHGILPHRSCPGTSEQNGRAKRKHRHLLDTTRALLISFGCPERFWGEVALTATYTINQVPSPLGNLTLYERLYGTLPDYHSLLFLVVLALSYYNHMSELNYSLGLVYVASWGMGLNIKAIVLSYSSAPPYLIEPSIELFHEDVNVSADLLDDNLHAAPPTIVYPVESPSTDSTPLVAPPIRRSTRVFCCLRCLSLTLGILRKNGLVNDLTTSQNSYGLNLLMARRWFVPSLGGMHMPR
ncbi:hypothetical protein Acr_07g0004120 [Actinidia rufa]|uniref:Uncharacterized protein n=1 Tax=Actinidia rufa TaxID=165716 RepID=A0A7J0EUP4_9ERIC|nr:hypothetical protein Acr_07g0004120 [Actinidia rufa]